MLNRIKKSAQITNHQFLHPSFIAVVQDLCVDHDVKKMVKIEVNHFFSTSRMTVTHCYCKILSSSFLFSFFFSGSYL